MPAVIEPLRERWNNIKATALAYGIAGNRDAAVKAVKDFHHYLCHLRILDPACGSGNFLYVTMEHMKRVEGEVLDLLRNDLAEPAANLQESINIDPHQFLGPRDQPACRHNRGSGVVDRISTMALQNSRKGHANPARPQELPQHPTR